MPYSENRQVVASWYGSEFHGRQTASGEQFNMHRLTCAHRELPFGTVLEVTNVSNRKSVTCTVNDRGPFVSGRELDLSYAAAREIGIINSGTGVVTITYRGRDTRYVKEVRTIAPEGPYTIQVGSFTESDNALHLKTGLALKYEAVYITEAFVNKRLFYRVRIGKFIIRDDAYALGKTIADEGYSPLIVQYEESR